MALPAHGLRMIFRTKRSDMICTVKRQGNAPSGLILVRATRCFVLHSRYLYMWVTITTVLGKFDLFLFNFADEIQQNANKGVIDKTLQ
jgi:hypothetical protein